MKQKKRIAIIILNYNSSDDTVRLVKNIRENESDYQVIVVDNHSTQVEMDKLEVLGGSKDVVIIRSKENIGYAAGNNIGLRWAMERGYEYFLIANSDTEIIHPNTVKAMKESMERYGAVALGPKMLNGVGDVDSGIIVDNKMGRTKRLEVSEVTECRSIIGAFLLLSRTIIDKVGFLPEEYFLYREETDYLVKAYEKKLKIIYDPEIEIIHRHGATTGGVWDYYFNRNTIYFARKIHGSNVVILALFHFLKSLYLTGMLLLGKQKRVDRKKAIILTWRGYLDGMTGKMGRKDNL